MSLYKISGNGTILDLYIVGNMSFGGEQAIVVHECPGSDGGAIILTGRRNKEITLTGNLISKEVTEDAIRDDLNTQINTLSTLRDTGAIIKLTTPLVQNDTGIYTIKSFNGNIIEGQLKATPFILILTEYRQRGAKQSCANLVNYAPGESLKSLYKQRTQGAT